MSALSACFAPKKPTNPNRFQVDYAPQELFPDLTYAPKRQVNPVRLSSDIEPVKLFKNEISTVTFASDLNSPRRTTSNICPDAPCASEKRSRKTSSTSVKLEFPKF